MKRAAWAGYPLGPPEEWPRELRTFLFMILVSPAPKAVLWGPDLFTFWNDACLRTFLGPQHLDRLGAPFRELLPEHWPVLSEHVQAAQAGEGRLIEAIETINPASGHPETVKACYTPLVGLSGNIVGVLAEMYDLTPAVRRERQLLDENEMLQKLFASAPVLIAYMRVPDYHIRFANPAMKNFFGGRPLEGRTVAEAAPELEAQGFIGLLDEVAHTGKAWTGVNHPVALSGEPEPRYVSFIYQPLLNDDGEVTHVLCSGYDATEGKLAQDLAAQLRHELLHASRLSAMSTMAMTLAHELNQPLCASASYLAAARRFLDSGDETHATLMREAFEEAAAEIQRAGEIVRRTRSLVTFGKSETAVVSLRECVDNAVKLLEASGNLGGLAVAVEIGADRVVADRIQVEQVLVNLLRNSAQASAGCARREAQVGAARKGDMVEISVRDWGRGLPQGEAAALFDAFGRVSRNGLGIGLSLCRTIIEAHGGQIGACDNEDGGARFQFTLPAAGGA
ncbi:MAG: PAS domain-containing protein [Sphingomonadaceae bacterium]|nr:PAS domain-containing protein [Sphingomonadaceae bacterium]